MKFRIGNVGVTALACGVLLGGGCSHVAPVERKTSVSDVSLASATAPKKSSTVKPSDPSGFPTQDVPRRQVIQVEGVARLPVFSTAIRSGDLIFLSGTLGTRSGVSPPQLVEGGVGPETRQIMENIRMILSAAGAGLQDLIKCTVFLADIGDYAAMNRVYAEFFTEDPPARSALAGGALALGARVEIECIAAAPQ